MRTVISQEAKVELEAYEKLPEDMELITHTQQQIQEKQKNINDLTGKYETLKAELGSEDLNWKR